MSSTRNLSRIPFAVQMRIVEATDTNTKLSLRSCSSQLKDLVDFSRISYHSLTFDWSYDARAIRIERTNQLDDSSLSVEFEAQQVGFIRSTDTRETVITRGNFIDASIAQFMKILRNPRARIENLEFKFSPSPYHQPQKTLIIDKLITALDSLPHQIQVGTLGISNEKDPKITLRLLEFLEVGSFEGFKFTWDNGRVGVEVVNFELREIAETEHWSHARRLTMCNYFLKLPRNKTDHFLKISANFKQFKNDDLHYNLQNFLRPNGWVYRCIRSPKYLKLGFAVVTLGNLENAEVIEDQRKFQVRQGDFECQVIVDKIDNVISFRKC